MSGKFVHYVYKSMVGLMMILDNRNDAKTVNVIAEACFSPVNKIAVTAIRFFLNTNEDEEEDESEEEVYFFIIGRDINV